MSTVTFTRPIDPYFPSGTCLKGYVLTTYDHIVSVFGQPDVLDGDKTTAEWHVVFGDGTIATIYDWVGSDYFGPTYKGLSDWHVGGQWDDHSGRAVALVAQALGAEAR